VSTICPVCEAGELRAWRSATASDPQLAGAETYELDRCEECGSAVTLGGPASAQALYEGGTYASARRGLGGLVGPLRRLADRDRMRFLAGLPPGARVLEVGAGDGAFVARLAAAGFEARGIEPSAAGRARAARIGARVEGGSAEDAEVAAASEDAVVLWHTLEHLEDPAASLRRAGGWLRPGGRLIVAVPDLASLQARIGGDRWFHQDVPRHRTHFTAPGLRRLLERCGYRVVRVRHLLVEQNPLGMWQTLLNRLTVERDFAFRMLKRDLPPAPAIVRALDLAITVVAGALLAPVAVVAELVAGLAGRGGTMVVEAVSAEQI
jgi:SAM-dependent methyltransferase